MKIEQGKFCPFIQGDCIQFKCVLFTQLRGSNPQTGDLVDEWNCAIAWLPMLLIENSQQSRQTAASVDSMRNEVVKRMDAPSPAPAFSPDLIALVAAAAARGKFEAPAQIVQRTHNP